MSVNALMGVNAMLAHTMKAGYAVSLGVYGNALVHVARNTALARSSGDYVLFVDDDMLPEPDALERLLKHNVPVVSALCTTRTPPIQHTVRVYDDEARIFVPVTALRPQALITGRYVAGCGFLLVRRDTIDELIEYYLSARDWLDENEVTLNRLDVGVRDRENERYYREVMRRRAWARDKSIRLFDFPVTDQEQQLGEDVAFSRKLINLGIPVAVDTSLPVAHLGERPYGIWDIEEETYVDVAR